MWLPVRAAVLIIGGYSHRDWKEGVLSFFLDYCISKGWLRSLIKTLLPCKASKGLGEDSHLKGQGEYFAMASFLK